MSRTSRELVAKVLNMFKNFMRIFSPKYFARLSRDGRGSVANLSPRNFGEFTMRNCDGLTKASISLTCEFLATVLANLSRTVARHSCECRGNFHVSRTSRELVAKVLNMFKNFMRFFSSKYFARLSRDRRATVVRRSCECREPVAAKFWRIYNVKISRQSRDMFSKLDRNSQMCRINVYSMSLQRESCVYIVNLCREIVANYSRTSL